MKTARSALKGFLEAASVADRIVYHNYGLTSKIIGAEMARLEQRDATGSLSLDSFLRIPHHCTMWESTEFCNLSGNNGLKWPQLQELHEILFDGKPFTGARGALNDAMTVLRCFFRLREMDIIKNGPRWAY